MPGSIVVCHTEGATGIALWCPGQPPQPRILCLQKSVLLGWENLQERVELGVTTREKQGACGSAEEITHPTGCMWKCRGNNTSYGVPRGSTQCPMAPPLHLLPPPLLHTSGNSAPSPGGSQGLVWSWHLHIPQRDLGQATSPCQTSVWSQLSSASNRGSRRKERVFVCTLDRQSDKLPLTSQRSGVESALLGEAPAEHLHMSAAVMRARIVPHSPRGMHRHCLVVYSYLSFRFISFPETLTFP